MSTPTFVLDFETYYDRDYSLSKMTTEAYVRDSRFQIIGVSAKRVGSSTPAAWSSLGSVAEYQQLLAPLAHCAVVAHNAPFDMAILQWVLGIRPKFIIDTLSMARPFALPSNSLASLAEYFGLGTKGSEVMAAIGKRREHFTPPELEAYGRYCCNDVDLTEQLLGKLVPYYSSAELQLVDQTIRLYTEPMLQLDKPVLQSHLADVMRRKGDAMREIVASLRERGEDTAVAKFVELRMQGLDLKQMLRSDAVLAQMLEACGVEPPKKISPATGVEAFAFAKTDKAFTELAEHPDFTVQTLVAARLNVKSTIEESRTQRFIDMADRGPFPVPLAYGGARTTWRWSGWDKINPQNWPNAGAIRKSIVAPPGHVIVAVDSSNIELRTNHTLAGQLDTVDMLRNGRDLYCELATRLYEREITKADEAERKLGKIAHLGLGYGMGAPKFKETCRRAGVILDDEFCERVVNLYRDTYHKIPAFWRSGESALKAIAFDAEHNVDTCGIVSTDRLGLVIKPRTHIYYNELTKTPDGWKYRSGKEWKYVYGGKVVENICQHVARNIIADQWLEIARRFATWELLKNQYARIVLQVHDELVAVVPEERALEAARMMIGVMSMSPVWWPQVPLAAEGYIGRNYSDMDKVK